MVFCKRQQVAFLVIFGVTSPTEAILRPSPNVMQFCNFRDIKNAMLNAYLLLSIDFKHYIQYLYLKALLCFTIPGIQLGFNHLWQKVFFCIQI